MTKKLRRKLFKDSSVKKQLKLILKEKEELKKKSKKNQISQKINN